LQNISPKKELGCRSTREDIPALRRVIHERGSDSRGLPFEFMIRVNC
jgi:hypothetical protein